MTDEQISRFTTEVGDYVKENPDIRATVIIIGQDEGAHVGMIGKQSSLIHLLMQTFAQYPDLERLVVQALLVKKQVDTKETENETED